MKNCIKIMIVLISLMSNLGCNDFLDVPPTTNITIPSTAQDYQDMLYPLGSIYTADAMIGIMGDEVCWSQNFYMNQSTDIMMRRAYLWESEVFDITNTVQFWTRAYSNIFTYNKVVNEVRILQGEPMGKLLKIEAEARLYRAMNYFHLINMFGMPYAMASVDTPGVPVILKNNVNETLHDRTPLQEVYRFVLSDLDSAVKYLPDYATLESRFLGSRIGAYGMKARVYFNMNKYPEALTELNHLWEILETKESPVGYEYKLLDYNQLALKNETEPWQGMLPAKDFPRYTGQEVRNVESVMTSQLYMRDPTIGAVYPYPNNPIFVSEHVLKFFNQEGDLREKFMLQERNTSGNYWDEDAPGLKLKRFSYSNAGVSMPDVYLMSAECYARAKDPMTALKYLNELRRHRFVQEKYMPLESEDATQVLKWVLEERMREFIATGHRWYDIRRLWNDPVGGNRIEKTRLLENQTYTLTQERLTLRIPEYVMQYHQDWKQNP